MIADELARARDACDALRSDDPLRPEMRSLLETIEKRLEGSEGTSRGRRPALPHRGGFLTKLAAHHRLRPSREKAYEVMDALLELCWPSGGANEYAAIEAVATGSAVPNERARAGHAVEEAHRRGAPAGAAAQGGGPRSALYTVRSGARPNVRILWPDRRAPTHGLRPPHRLGTIPGAQDNSAMNSARSAIEMYAVVSRTISNFRQVSTLQLVWSRLR